MLTLCQPGSADGKPPAPLLAAEHLALRVNPNGMLPMILASVLVHAVPSGLAVLFGPLVGAAVAVFQRSAAQPILFCVAVFFADFASITQQTPKRLAQYLQAVRMHRARDPAMFRLQRVQPHEVQLEQ